MSLIDTSNYGASALKIQAQASVDKSDATDLDSIQKKFSDTLNSIKAANNDKTNSTEKEKQDKALKQECDDFESIMVKMMLTSMRQTIPKSDLFTDDSNAMDTYQDMLDDEYSKAVSKRGIGVSDALYKQLSKAVDAKYDVSSNSGLDTKTVTKALDGSNKN